MSISSILGLPGAGKSCFVVDKICNDLIKTNRPISTNLPIYVDKLALAVLSETYKKNSILYTDELNAIFMRIQVFIDLSDKEFMEEFILLNPKFWEISERVNYLINSGTRTDLKPLIVDVEQVSFFWLYSKPNSFIYFDEVYEFFSPQKIKSLNDKQREEYESYFRQHRHFEDDIYLITHDYADFEPFLRRSIAFRLEIINSLNQTIWDDKECENKLYLRWAKGLKYLKQFFIINEYFKDQKQKNNSYIVIPNLKVFSYYNSFSKPKGLDKDYLSESNEKKEFKHDTMSMFVDWLWKSRLNLLYFMFMVCVGIGLLSVPFGLINFFKKPKTKKVVKVEKVEDSKKSSEVKKNLSAMDQYVKVDYYINNKMSISGCKYGVGDSYNNKKIKEIIENEKVIFSDGSFIIINK